MSLRVEPIINQGLFIGRFPVRKLRYLDRAKPSIVETNLKETDLLSQLRGNILSWIKNNPDKSFAYAKYMTGSSFIYAGLSSSGIVSKGAYLRGALDFVEGAAVHIIGKKRIISFAKKIIENMKMINLANSPNVMFHDNSAQIRAFDPLLNKIRKTESSPIFLRRKS